MTPRISALFVYPIKSCAGIARKRLRVGPEGTEDDRLYMVVDETGTFVTARTEPKLLSVAVDDAEGGFVARARGRAPLFLPREHDGRAVEATVWRDTVTAFVHEEGSAFFSSYLGRDLRLVHCPAEFRRVVNPERTAGGERVAFADGYPLLLVSEASLADLNERLAEGGESPVPMSRFRPNVVVSGLPPHGEDLLVDFSLGSVRCSMPKLCDRCVMTTIEPTSPVKSREPLRTLGTYRKWDGKVWFGANVIARNAGDLALDDELALQ